MNKKLCQETFKRKLSVKNVFWCEGRPIFLLNLSKKDVKLFVLEVVQNFIHPDCSVTPMDYPLGTRFLSLNRAAARHQPLPPTALKRVDQLGRPIKEFARKALTDLPQGQVALCLLFRHDKCGESADCCMVTEEYAWRRSSNGTGEGNMTRIAPQLLHPNPVPLVPGSTTPCKGGRSQSPAGRVSSGDIGQDVTAEKGGRHSTTTTATGEGLQGHQGDSQRDSWCDDTSSKDGDGSCYHDKVRHPMFPLFFDFLPRF